MATVGLLNSKKRFREELEQKWGARVVYGMRGGPDIYNEKYLSGVAKEPVELFATPIGRNEDIRAGRAIAQDIADEISGVSAPKKLSFFDWEWGA